MNTTEKQSGGLGAVVAVYFCFLAIAGLQVVLAYQGASFVPMLALGFLEALLALTFFMNLRMERRNLVVFIALFTLFVMATMNYGWTDSFRLLNGAPFSK